ncbi:MAG: septum formation initiator family protein [Candidatus Omnitrophica bacterium]|nr:septum formation initiator family protein [Candidatus Omnitrophota bacterium]
MGTKRPFFIGVAIAAALLLVYGAGTLRWLELRAERARLEWEISALKAENKRLYEEAKRLREDPSYAEAVARKEFGFVRPGETKIKITPKKTASSE